MLKASVVLATFDQPQELRFVLTALMRQSESQFEILLADDGSGPATKSVIEEFKNKLNILGSRTKVFARVES